MYSCYLCTMYKTNLYVIIYHDLFSYDYNCVDYNILFHGDINFI